MVAKPVTTDDEETRTQSSILWAGQAAAEIYGTNNNLQTWTSHDFRNWMWPSMLLHRVVRHVITNPLGKLAASIFRAAKNWCSEFPR